MDITKEQYKAALSAEGVLKERSVELLNMLYDAPNCQATSPQLAQMLGYESFSPVNALVGQLGKRIANHIGIQMPERQFNSPGWWQIIAHGEDTPAGFTWQLKEQLFDAMVELGLLQDSDARLYPEVVPPESEIYEGKASKVLVNAYERNSVARRICVNHYGARCVVCSFDFEKKFGEIGSGFIHVHHLIELSAIGREYKVDPIKDLRPVCPNCHSMLHQRRPPYSIEELRGICGGRT